MTTAEASKLLDLIAERAPKLRASGVLTVELGGDGAAAFTLAPAEPRVEPPSKDAAPDDEPSDTLRSQWTHGVPNDPANAKPLKVTRRPL